VLDFKDLDLLSKKYNFYKVGVSRSFLNSFFKEKFVEAINSGLYDGLKWLLNRKDIRLNPAKYFPWVKSILVFVDNYFYPFVGVTPTISKYALGLDYHNIIRVGIQSVMEDLKKKYNELIYKVYVDHGPFLEKVYAVQAGIGSYGKNSVVYFNNIGSYCFIGIALINMEVVGFPNRENRTDICGDCDICIKSCPAGAIIKPYVVDPSKCISYLTIEKKGAFSIEEKSNIKKSGYFYGCDICQDVCPLNKQFARDTVKAEYFKNKYLFEGGIDKLFSLDSAEFMKIFNSTAIERIGFDRFKRNLEIFR